MMRALDARVRALRARLRARRLRAAREHPAAGAITSSRSRRVASGNDVAITCVPRLVGRRSSRTAGGPPIGSVWDDTRFDARRCRSDCDHAPLRRVPPARPSTRRAPTGRRFRWRRSSSAFRSRCSSTPALSGYTPLDALADDHRWRVHHVADRRHRCSRRTSPITSRWTIDACSDHFVRVLESTCQAKLEPGNTVEILTDGSRFYPAMLETIRGARETINMECYIFKKGEIGDAFHRRRCASARRPACA